MEGDLDVRIFSDKLNALVQAPKNASCYAFKAFVNWVFFITNFFVLIDHILENDSDHLNNCDQERSKCYRATMVPSSPSEGFHDINAVS